MAREAKPPLPDQFTTQVWYNNAGKKKTLAQHYEPDTWRFFNRQLGKFKWSYYRIGEYCIIVPFSDALKTDCYISKAWPYSYSKLCARHKHIWKTDRAYFRLQAKRVAATHTLVRRAIKKTHPLFPMVAKRVKEEREAWRLNLKKQKA